MKKTTENKVGADTLLEGPTGLSWSLSPSYGVVPSRQNTSQFRHDSLIYSSIYSDIIYSFICFIYSYVCIDYH